MATKAKKKYVSKNHQEETLKAFYDGLGDNENNFVVHRFLMKMKKMQKVIPVMKMIMIKITKGMMVMKQKKNARLKMIVIITMMLFLKKRLLVVEVKKITRDQITRLMELTMYKKNQQENKNSRISIKL